MKKFKFLLLLLGIYLSASAFQEHKLSCMYSKRCKKNVNLITNINDIKRQFPNNNYDNVADEFNQIINNLKQLKVKVFLGDKKYFPVKYTGIYTTYRNNIFLNKRYMNIDIVLIRTLRHEAWHVAQDCKAGIENGKLDMIIDPKYLPKSYINYELGAKIASTNIGMTEAALKSCFTNDYKYIEKYFEK
tara:strand:+ start:191 stop:754 length:564 start_codon:yes stop_codon:yes gene_type:complete